MFLSKIWFILIALVSGVAVTFALIAPRPAVQKLGALEGQRLDRAQYAAEQMFKVDAHKWIDFVSKLGRDAIISESLDSSSRGAGEWGVLHRTVQDRFRALIPGMAGGLESVVALDNKGRVVARLGDNDKEYGDYMGGAEVIADALRGYLSDDVWGSNAKLERVAAAPVLSKGRDRIVGAVYIGAETGPALVERLKKNLDVDVALLLRGKIIASSRNSAELEALPDLISQHGKEIAEVKRTPAISFNAGQDALLTVAAPFPGQAGQQQAYYALVGMQPAKSDLASLLGNATSDDLKWGRFPWVPLAAAVFLMIAIGLALQRLEVEWPLRRLRKELQQLARGEIHKIQDGRYGGRFGGLARDVNAAMERYTHAPAPAGEMSGKDLNAILGGAPGSGGGAFDMPAPDSAFSGSTPAPAFAPPPAPAFAPPPAPAFAPPPPPAFAPPPSIAAAGGGFGTGVGAGIGAVAGAGGGGLGTASMSSFPPVAPAPPKPIGWAPPLPTAALDGGGGTVSPSFSGPGDSEATRVMAYDENQEEEAHFKHVFDDFIATKRQCGESVAGLTLDKFIQKLRDNKAALMSKHACKTVRFSVYVKDGKAALKATPMRE
jgi:hypothetical protein